MKKLLLVSALAVISLSVPQLASAQGSPQAPNQQSVQARVKNNLEQAGFTNVQIMPSSFLVRAKDKEGNPVMMVINPDSVTAITELTGDHRSGTQTPATTGTAATNDYLNLTSAQRQEIWQSVSKQAAKEAPPAGFTAKVGEAVPSAVKLQPLPSSVSSQVPAVKPFEYAMLQNQVLIVDPSSKKIVDIITQMK
jgi:hypothetical protein